MAGAFFIKQGGLLQLAIQVQQDDGTPVDITAAVLFSEIRDAYGELVATPVLTITGATMGEFNYSAQSSLSWPTGKLKSDIFINMIGGASVPYFTQTFFVDVGVPVTNIADKT